MGAEQRPPRRKIRRPRTRRQLQRERLAALAGMTFLERPEDIQSALDRIVEVTARYLPANGGSSILLVDPRTGKLSAAATTVPGERPEDVIEQTRPEGATAWILKHRKPFFVRDIMHDERHAPNPRLAARGLRGFVGYPLLWRKEPLGVLYALFREPRRLSQEDWDFLQILARRAANAVVLARMYERLQELAFLDDLTRVFNRRGFFDRARAEWARAERTGRPLSLLILDVDNFKEINDTLGHLAGDRVLVEIARTLKKTLRESDVIGRYGGDEFVVLLPETPREQAQRIAHRIQEALKSLDVGISIQVSIGVAERDPARDGDLFDLLRRADRALYRAKEHRNTVVSD